MNSVRFLVGKQNILFANGVVKINDPVLVYQRISYRCIHHGEISSKTKVRNSRSSRTGCGAKFNIKLENDKLVAGKANLIHNHPTDPKKAKMYHRNLRPDDEMQPAVETLLSVKPKTEAFREVLKGKSWECV